MFFFSWGTVICVNTRHPQCQTFSPSFPHSAMAKYNVFSQHRALMEKDQNCFAKSALILINDGNLSADSQSASLPGSSRQHPSLVWVTRRMWASKHNTSPMERWRGSVQIIHQRSLVRGWYRGWATSYTEPGPCLDEKMAEKTVTKIIQLLKKVVFFCLCRDY